MILPVIAVGRSVHVPASGWTRGPAAAPVGAGAAAVVVVVVPAAAGWAAAATAAASAAVVGRLMTRKTIVLVGVTAKKTRQDNG